MKNKKGFTLIEILLVIAIVAILSAIVIVAVNPQIMIRDAKQARIDSELNQIAKAVNLYYLDNQTWPPDAGRGLPNEIDNYLSFLDWSNAPFNETSVYDWDNYISDDGNQALQISIRFCTGGIPNQCDFPNEDWAENFDASSSYYYCIQGQCKSHPNQPADHPGYCANC